VPNHLSDMALFAVNTGCCDGEICNLRWSWHVPVPELNTAVFIIPSEYVKNGDERLVVLNTIANDVIIKHRGKNAEPVFTYNSTPITRMLNTGWIRKKVCQPRTSKSPRSKTHLRKKTKISRRMLRKQTRFVGPPIRPNNHPLLRSRVVTPSRSRE